MNKSSSNSLKDSVLEVDLEYTKELRELCKDYRLAPNKIEIKSQMFSNYQMKMPDFYNIPNGNVKILVPNFVLIKKSMCFIMKTWNFIFKVTIKTKKIHHALEFNHSGKNHMLSSTHKIIEAEKNGDKYGKYAMYGKTMENLRNKTDVKIVSNKQDYLKWIWRPSYMSQKIFDNDLVAICKKQSYINT